MNAIYCPPNDNLTKFFKSLTELANQVYIFIFRIPWLIALFLVMPVGILILLFLYVPIRISRYRLERKINLFLKHISDYPKREAMIFHSDIEDIRKKSEEVSTVGKGILILKPFNIEIEKTSKIFKRLEDALFSYVYPDYGKPISKEEEQELVEAFKEWTSEE